MDLTEYWIWWGLTAILCCGSIAHGAARPRELLGAPVVLSMMWIYFYVYLSYQAVTNLPHLFLPEVLATSQFLACASLASLLLGWHLFRRRRVHRQPTGVSYDHNTLFAVGIAWLAIGGASSIAFRYSGTTMQESSAYIYTFYNVGFAGAGLCAAVMAQQRVSSTRLVLLLLLLCLLIGPSVATARRGPTFAGIIAVVFGYTLARRSLPRVWQVVGTLGCVGVLLLFLVEARSYVYRGMTWNDAFEGLSLDSVLLRRSLDAGDNEFVNHCVQIQANQATGLYQYGTTHLLMALHWVPRDLWPDKPQRSVGLYPQARDHFKPGFVTNLGFGGAWGSVADAFDNYGFFCLVFWFAVGALTVLLFNRVRATDDLAPCMYYLGLLMSSHWFIAQSLSEAMVPALFFQLAFWISLRWSRRRPHRAPGSVNFNLRPIWQPGR